MTALDGLDRFETTALWRETADAQRREVYVAIGEAELVVQDRAGVALSHWSLPALDRINPGEVPARYRPAPGAEEELEIAEPEMIAALDRVSDAVEMGRRRPGALRRVTVGLVAGLVVGTLLMWLPGALRDHAANVMPAPQREQIGERMLMGLTQLTGPPCGTILGDEALANLATRLSPTANIRVAVLRDLPQPALALPGGLIALSDTVLVTQDDPEVAAGHLLAAIVTARLAPPIQRFLAGLGPIDLTRLLGSGAVPDDAIDAHVESLLLSEAPLATTETLRAGFAAARLPWPAFAAHAGLDRGEAPLTELPPIIDDTTWQSLREICDG
ncbi:hypothetical protein ACK8OR_01235 [Jannaschia sp. KMU-145]|uniref:hypothetical protein n=1 Tax=Jannaschia halovivens TaxID=3388667 RepID=UPI00396B3F1E